MQTLLLRLALSPFFLSRLGLACCQLAGDVYNHTAIVTAARRARPMRHAHIAALTFREALGCKGVMRTAVCRMRMGMSHPIDHTKTIAKYG